MYIHPYIYDVLSRAVGAVMGSRIYPVSAPAGTALPFATFKIDASRASGTKDGASADVRVQVALVGKSLADLHKTADDIVSAMEQDAVVAVGYDLDWPRWMSTEELYDLSVDGYVLTITINYRATKWT